MNWLDVVILIFWGIAALYGFRTGLFRALVPLAVVLGGLALSSRISGHASGLFASVVSNENTQTIMAFLVVFLVILIAGLLVSHWLRIVLRFVPFFGLADGLGGAVVGVAVGFVVLSGVVTATQKFPVGNVDRTIQASYLGSFLADNFSVVMRGVRLIPVDWDAKVDDLKDALPENIPTSLPDNLPKSIPELIPNINPQNRPQIRPDSNQ